MNAVGEGWRFPSSTTKRDLSEGLTQAVLKVRKVVSWPPLSLTDDLELISKVLTYLAPITDRLKKLPRSVRPLQINLEQTSTRY